VRQKKLPNQARGQEQKKGVKPTTQGHNKYLLLRGLFGLSSNQYDKRKKQELHKIFKK
jgi:hypothetical protein